MSSLRPLISIIIPVYNTEKYLNRCVESVLNQSYHNLEIILVNDGSTDNSGQICDEYQAKDPRVAVIHKQNQGVSKARSTGIEVARGEYIVFVDSDDWIDTVMCEEMMKALSRYKVQSVMCAYVREYPGRSLPREVNPHDVVFDNRTLLRRLCGLVGEELRHPENLDNYNMMCGKLYPAAPLKGITLTDIKTVGSSEDMLFNLDSYAIVESMVYINQPFYHYRRSIMTSITGAYKPELEKQWDTLYDKIWSFIEANQLDDRYTSALSNRIALNVLGLGLNCLRDDAPFLEKCRRLNRTITTPRRKAALKRLPLKHMPVHWKLFYFSAKHKLTVLLYILLLVIVKLKGKV